MDIISVLLLVAAILLFVVFVIDLQARNTRQMLVDIASILVVVALFLGKG